MFMRPFRAAVFGATGRGDYGHGLDVAFRDHPALQLVAVADPDEAGRHKAAERLRVSSTYADYRALLDKEKPRFVAVCPRWIDHHFALLSACVERGIHVFTEKPLVPTLADCDALRSACDRTHAKVAMAFQTRYSKRFLHCEKMIADGAIGEVLELRARGKEDARAGGEDLFVLGTHVLDMMCAIAGAPSWCMASVTQGGHPITADGVRPGNEGLGPLAGDRIDAMFGLGPRGTIGHFASVRSDPASRRFGLTVFGTKGAIFIGMGADPPAWHVADPTWLATAAPVVPILPTPDSNAGAAFAAANLAIVDDLVRAVENDTQPRAGLAEGINAVEMVLAVFAAQVKGTRVEMPLSDRASHPLARLAGGRIDAR